jgi:hypothetical protein
MKRDEVRNPKPNAKRIDVVGVKGVSQIGFCVKTPTGKTAKIAFLVVWS